MEDPNTNRNAGPLQPAIRVLLMPKDTNALGTIFGGIILSYIDQAGAVEAHRYVPCPGGWSPWRCARSSSTRRSSWAIW